MMCHFIRSLSLTRLAHVNVGSEYLVIVWDYGMVYCKVWDMGDIGPPHSPTPGLHNR